MIVGHAHHEVLRAIHEAMQRGHQLRRPDAARDRDGAPPRRRAAVDRAGAPGVLRHRGDDDRASAWRAPSPAAPKIVKFDGCYHGHADPLLVRAGSGAMTLGVPDSAGVPEAIASLTLVARFNDLAEIEARFAAEGDAIAAVIVEPVVGNMGLVPPAAGFLDGLRRITERHGALLIFDEVMTGFRLAWGGVQMPLDHPARPHLSRQGDRRRPAAGGGRRPARRDAAAGPGRRRLPGGHAVGESARRQCRPRDARRCSTPAGVYERLEAAGRQARRRACAPPCAGTGGAAASSAPARCGRSSSASTPCATPSEARAADTDGLRPLLHRHAGTRRLPAAVAVRGRLHLAGAQRRRHRDAPSRAADQALAAI